MSEQLFKLTPNRDLQCYFQMPSAIAAMSQATETGFVLSGKWRQQFDWAVVEWNRDNTFEHPALRYLPDGDLSGLVLSYTEQRQGCFPIESNVYPIVDWPNLRIWATPAGGVEQLYTVPIAPLAKPAAGQYVTSVATMTLTLSPGVGNRVGLAVLEQHFYYTVATGDMLADIAAGIAANINDVAASLSAPDFIASSNGASVYVTWSPHSNNKVSIGANGNRVSVYGFAQGSIQPWQQLSAPFTGGQFPTAYNVNIDFGALKASGIPTNNIRKMRWTWAADLQASSFQPTEFQVQISNWSISGSNRAYYVAGPGSRRIENDGSGVSYFGNWTQSSGNYSGSTIQCTTEANDYCAITYSEADTHQLYLGTRLLTTGANCTVTLDGRLANTLATTSLSGEDVLVRIPFGTLSAGTHTIQFQHQGPSGADLFFDFLEIVYPSANLPDFVPNRLSLATDWDTYHSQSLPAERTAWLIQKLGYLGRANHYAGALWFYEIYRPQTTYASLTVSLVAQQYTGSPMVKLNITTAPNATPSEISHLVLLDDTPETVTQAFANLINAGTNSIWASASGYQLTVTARAMGPDGNGIGIALAADSAGYSLSGGSQLGGGVYGAPYTLDTSSQLNTTLIAAADYWRTDLSASPTINRAARDWHTAFFGAMKAYGIDVTVSFSTELLNGDPDPATGIVQQYPDATPVVLNTPAVQTNFSPISTAFWAKTYLQMASLQAAAGLRPYLQFGEVQWWYFPNAAGMPFYDAYTKAQFQAEYGVPMQTIGSNTVDPSMFPNETAFLPTVIGAYTAAIRNTVFSQYPNARFEVLYPTDTNDTNLNQLVNFPSSDWTSSNLTCLKTESFSFTGSNNLDLSKYSIDVSAAKGFPANQRSHLVGIGSASTAWGKEVDLAQAEGLESVVLFALDQYCLIGYPPPPFVRSSRAVRQG